MMVTSSTGLIVESAYIKIDEYSCDKQNNVFARIRAYVSKELENSGSSPIEGSEDLIEITADYSEEAVNTKKQIYNHMKKLEKYSNAIDVLEN